MHRSRPADATAGPDGAYSLDSCEEEKNLAMNPLIPFCWLVAFVVGDAGVDVVAAVVDVVPKADELCRGESGRLAEIDRLRRNRCDRQAICLHKLGFVVLPLVPLFVVVCPESISIPPPPADDPVVGLESSCASPPPLLCCSMLLEVVSGIISICCSSMVFSGLLLELELLL